MTYAELKTERQKRYDELMEKVGIFWAFSNEQFEEGRKKYPLKKGFKYQSIGAGGYFAGQFKEEFVGGMTKLNDWEKQARAEVRDTKSEIEKQILHELRNYECFYNGEIDDVVDLFEGVYSKEQIAKVYKKYFSKEA